MDTQMSEKLEDVILELAEDEYERSSEEAANCGAPFKPWNKATKKDKQEYINQIKELCNRIRSAI